MPSKSFALKKNHPVVEQFRAGLRMWEHPRGEPDRADNETSGPVRKANTIRVRGAVRVGQKLSSSDTDSSPITALPDDVVVEQFRDGLARWERRFERGNKDE